MRTHIAVALLVLAIVVGPTAITYAGGGFSGGGFHSSGSFGGGFHSSSFSSFHSSGSMGSYHASAPSTYHSSGGFSSGPTRSTGSLFSSTPKPASAPTTPSPTVIYHDTYSSNPLSTNFWFWMWITGRHNSPGTIINNTTVMATTTATTTP